MHKKIRIFIAISISLMVLLLNEPSSAQDKSKLSSFRELSPPEKWWVFMHPFIAVRTFEISQKSREVAKQIKQSDILDGDIHGGQVDAFKHAYWMALLVQEISARKARRLGIVHEKGDYIQFKRSRRKNKNAVHDEAASAMDLFNNEVGREIGLQHSGATPDEIREIILDAVLKGKMRIIKKDHAGNFLDENGEIIPPTEYNQQWENPKVLVPSNQVE